MQSDEEIGKVSRPVVVGRVGDFHVELGGGVWVLAKKSGVRRIGAAHIRAAVEKRCNLTFLRMR